MTFTEEDHSKKSKTGPILFFLALFVATFIVWLGRPFPNQKESCESVAFLDQTGCSDAAFLTRARNRAVLLLVGKNPLLLNFHLKLVKEQCGMKIEDLNSALLQGVNVDLNNLPQGTCLVISGPQSEYKVELGSH